MRHHRIHESRQRQGVAQIRRHLAPLGQSPRHNRRRARRKCKLKHPKHQIVHSHKKEVLRPDERLLRIAEVHSAVSKGVADGVKSQGGAAGIEQVFEHGVLDVLELDAAGAQHGEAGLHQEDEGGGVDEEECVEAVGVGFSYAL
mmetsp:Transcript_21811/g.44518  ORF Transcript_21811/g.44518 Transcript_21811/m.44518 type:complete len:144 (-) Transcript_21811:48-479(-)